MVWVCPILAEGEDSIIEVVVIVFFIAIGAISAAVKKAQASAEQKRQRQRWQEQDRARGEQPKPVSPARGQARPRPVPPPPPKQPAGWQVVELEPADQIALERARRQAQQQETEKAQLQAALEARRSEELRRRQQAAAAHKCAENERLIDHHLDEGHVASVRFRGSTTRAASKGSKGIRVNLTDPVVARNAILFQEILGQPKALRDPDDEPWNR